MGCQKCVSKSKGFELMDRTGVILTACYHASSFIKAPPYFFLNSWKKMPKQLLVFLDSQLKNTDKIRTESQLEHFRILVCFSDNCFIYFFLKRIVLLHPFFKTYHLNIVDRFVLFIIKKLRVKKKKQVNFFSPSSSSYRRK